MCSMAAWAEAAVRILSIDGAVQCRIVERINRFVVLVQLNGKKYRAYINNTGRLSDFLVKGRVGFCVSNERPGKTDYRLFALQDEALGAVIDTQLQMRAFEQALMLGCIPWLDRCKMLKRNAVLGRSLIDYLLVCDGEQVYLEIKSAVLRRGRYASYPDCPSARGRKHIRELWRYVEQGGRAILLFIAALPGANAFRPNCAVDPQLCHLLSRAYRAGVDVRAMGMHYDARDSSIYLSSPDIALDLPKS